MGSANDDSAAWNQRIDEEPQDEAALFLQEKAFAAVATVTVET